jgi:hypothetical protein
VQFEWTRNHGEGVKEMRTWCGVVCVYSDLSADWPGGHG